MRSTGKGEHWQGQPHLVMVKSSLAITGLARLTSLPLANRRPLPRPSDRLEEEERKEKKEKKNIDSVSVYLDKLLIILISTQLEFSVLFYKLI